MVKHIPSVRWMFVCGMFAGYGGADLIDGNWVMWGVNTVAAVATGIIAHRKGTILKAICRPEGVTPDD